MATITSPVFGSSSVAYEKNSNAKQAYQDTKAKV